MMAGRKLAVYGITQAGDMELLRRGLTDSEAKVIADDHYRRTGNTAVIVIQEEAENGTL